MVAQAETTLCPVDGYENKNMDVFQGNHGVPKAQTPSDSFIWSKTDEPHALRSREIRKKYPQIKKLFGIEPMTKWIVLGLVSVQIGAAVALRNEDFFSWRLLVCAYVLGATVTQALFLAIHDISHSLAFFTVKYNKYLGLFANLPILFPYFVSFKGYHMEHHRYQGADGIDVDIPTWIETKLFSSTAGKLFFCCFQILFYGFRPLFVRRQVFTAWHAANWIIEIIFGVVMYNLFGVVPLWYFFLSVLLAGSLHPCAAHFIAEHYVFVGDYETYSYYGPLNALTFNVGYHHEHHDFPRVPWSRLPKVRALAPEFYDSLPHHDSWVKVMWNFIFMDNVSTKNRVKRADHSNVKRHWCGAQPQ